MKFELLDNESEGFFKSILEMLEQGKKMGKILHLLHKTYGQENSDRILNHLCDKRYLKMVVATSKYPETKTNITITSYAVTQDGAKYFINKEEYLKGQKQMFHKLPSNSRKLLQEILDADNPTQMLCDRFKDCSNAADDELRSLLRELIQDDYIKIVWADDVPYNIQINNSARTYAEREVEYERQLKLSSAGATYNINSITSSGGNLILGNVIDSTLNVDNSIRHIEYEIERKGGEDKAILLALLEEAKELIDNLKSTHHISKNKGFFTRLTAHLEKHGWFYAEIVGLLGTAVLNMIQG